MTSFVRKVGSQLHVSIDGVIHTAMPTPNDEYWIITAVAGPPPDPGDGDFSWPFNPATTVTSEYGPRGGGAGTFHEGIDFGKGNAIRGASIYSCGAGTISAANNSSGYGPYIDVFHGTISGRDVYIRYGHLDRYDRWSYGMTVAKGALIGLEDDGGVSQGANLHLETHLCAIGGSPINDLIDHSGSNRTAIDPRQFFGTYGDGGVLNP